MDGMTLNEECALSFYRTVAVLNKAHRVELVQNIQTGKIFVKKQLDAYNINVYAYLKTHPVKDTPRIYEVIEDAGVLTVIEEYISGSTLQEKLNEGERYTAKQAAELVIGLCRILRTLHEARPPIVHRDIKPSNIMITPDGTVKLLDMDAAKQAYDRSGNDTQLMGTVGFAAPEQYGFGVSSIQTDIYSLGVLLNYMLCGSFPKDRLCGGVLRPVVEKCTQMDPDERYDSTAALERALMDAAGIHGFTPVLGGLKKYAPPGFRGKNPVVHLLAGCGYILVMALGAQMTVENGTLWLNRLVFILMMLSVILISGNYMDILDRSRVRKIKSRALRIMAVIGIDVAVIMLWLFILMLGESLLRG